jgi:hypothetical protein
MIADSLVIAGRECLLNEACKSNVAMYCVELPTDVAPDLVARMDATEFQAHPKVNGALPARSESASVVESSEHHRRL